MTISKSDIAEIPDSAFKSREQLKEALHRQWSDVTFTDETLARMIVDRKKKERGHVA